MTLTQAELVLEEKEKYPDPIVDRAVGIVMEDHFMDEIMSTRRE